MRPASTRGRLAMAAHGVRCWLRILGWWEFIRHVNNVAAVCRSNTGPSAATNPCTEGRVQLQCAETAHAGSASCWGDDNSNSVLDFKALFEGQGHKEPVRCSACGN